MAAHPSEVCLQSSVCVYVYMYIQIHIYIYIGIWGFQTWDYTLRTTERNGRPLRTDAVGTV